MNTIGSHPGAVRFRLAVMVIVIAILMLVFFSYLDGSARALERQSVLQTKRIIDSSLTVVFAEHAVRGELHKLDEVDGANPFEFLRQLAIPVPSYRGEIESELDADLAPGWYFQKHRARVAYKSHFGGKDSYFRVNLGYEDSNRSGRFESGFDRFRYLRFDEIPDPAN